MPNAAMLAALTYAGKSVMRSGVERLAPPAISHAAASVVDGRRTWPWRTASLSEATISTATGLGLRASAVWTLSACRKSTPSTLPSSAPRARCCWPGDDAGMCGWPWLLPSLWGHAISAAAPGVAAMASSLPSRSHTHAHTRKWAERCGRGVGPYTYPRPCNGRAFVINAPWRNAAP